jgi:DNA-binding FadR family transcriptional regulator
MAAELWNESVYFAMTGDHADSVHRCTHVARLIEDQIAATGLRPGDNFGREEELSRRYGVGRSAVREAIRILERRGMGRMRPGRCGGFIVAQPTLDTVSEASAEFFHLAGTTVQQLIEAREAVDCLAVRFAAERAASVQVDFSNLEIPEESGALLTQLSFRSALARLTGNPAVLLMTQCMNRLTLRFAPQRDYSGQVRQQQRGQITQIIAALRAGDATRAATVMQASTDQLEHLLTAATSEPSQNPSVVPSMTRAAEVARDLAKRIGAQSAGTRLGSEWELCEYYNASRLVLRQAVRILEDSGIVQSRRGRGFGLMTRKPDAAAVIRLIGAYLMSHRPEQLEINKLVCHLNIWMPALAALRGSGPERVQLRALIATLRVGESIEVTQLLGLLCDLSKLAANLILDTFSRCLIGFDARVRPLVTGIMPIAEVAGYLAMCDRLLSQTDLSAPATLSAARAAVSAFMLELGRREIEVGSEFTSPQPC